MAGSIVRSILFVVLFVLAVWAIAQLAGIKISLVGTLVGSVVLTLIANTVVSAYRSFKRG